MCKISYVEITDFSFSLMMATRVYVNKARSPALKFQIVTSPNDKESLCLVNKVQAFNIHIAPVKYIEATCFIADFI